MGLLSPRDRAPESLDNNNINSLFIVIDLFIKL